MYRCCSLLVIIVSGCCLWSGLPVYLSRPLNDVDRSSNCSCFVVWCLPWEDSPGFFLLRLRFQFCDRSVCMNSNVRRQEFLRNFPTTRSIHRSIKQSVHLLTPYPVIKCKKLDFSKMDLELITRYYYLLTVTYRPRTG